MRSRKRVSSTRACGSRVLLLAAFASVCWLVYAVILKNFTRTINHEPLPTFSDGFLDRHTTHFDGGEAATFALWKHVMEAKLTDRNQQKLGAFVRRSLTNNIINNNNNATADEENLQYEIFSDEFNETSTTPNPTPTLTTTPTPTPTPPPPTPTPTPPPTPTSTSSTSTTTSTTTTPAPMTPKPVMVPVAPKLMPMRTTFNFLINQPDICWKQQQSETAPSELTPKNVVPVVVVPYVIAYIHTTPSNFEKRETIRQTWVDPQYAQPLGIKYFFIMGLPSDYYSTIQQATGESFNATNSSSSSVMERVLQESIIYGDIVMADFNDSYWNLTLKNLAGLRWIQQYCLTPPTPAKKTNGKSETNFLWPRRRRRTRPAYVLKADDDVFIDTFRLVRYLRSVDIFYAENNSKNNNKSQEEELKFVPLPQPPQQQQQKKQPPTKPDPDEAALLKPVFSADSTSTTLVVRYVQREALPPPTRQTFFGFTYVKSRPIRTENKKWFITKEEYAGATYPEYCAGAAYLHTTDVVEPLLAAASKRASYMSIDDVLVTGILRTEIGAHIQAWNDLYRFGPEITNCQLNSDTVAKTVASAAATAVQQQKQQQNLQLVLESNGKKPAAPRKTLGQCYISRRYVFVH